MTQMIDVLVDAGNLRSCVAEAADVQQLQQGQVLVRIDKWGFTANNISYATAGRSLKYFDFFPAARPADRRTKGRVPVWGYADVVSSRSACMPEGTRLYGFWPMSTHCVLEPKKTAEGHWVDAAKHRSHLALVYNQYQAVRSRSEDEENWTMLLRPLYVTGWLLDDFMSANSFFGADTVLISSASSKTSYGLAFELQANKHGRKVIGLTSASNVEFVRKLGCYDEIVTYQNITSIPRTNVVFIDMAGNRHVLSTIHNHFGEGTKYSCLVGQTHWEFAGRDRKLPGAKPTFFFAPGRVKARSEEWTQSGLMRRIDASWRKFVAAVATVKPMKITYACGVDEVLQQYKCSIEGTTRPDEGYIQSLTRRTAAKL